MSIAKTKVRRNVPTLLLLQSDAATSEEETEERCPMEQWKAVDTAKKMLRSERTRGITMALSVGEKE